MVDPVPTLLTFLWSGSAKAGSAMLAGSLKHSLQVASVTPLPVQWNQITQALEDQITGVFNLDLVSMLIRAWSDMAEIREATDRARTPPGTTRIVTLMEHEVELTDHPEIVIAVDGMKAFTVDLEIGLKMTFKSATLTIRDGKVRKIALGSGEGEISLKSGPAVLLRHALPGKSFPGSIEIPEGVAPGPASKRP